MKLKIIGISFLSALMIACFPIENESKSCYRIEDGKVFLRYYGGYPRAKEVLRNVKEADAKSFKYIEGSREGDCQSGHMFAKDKNQVFYRDKIIMFADPQTFEALSYGYSKDKNKAFYRNEEIDKSDARSFFIINNKKKEAYAADKYGLIHRDKRIGDLVDVHSFEPLFKPYTKDKYKVYYSEEFHILEGADPETFNCPKFESIVNFQYYSFDKNRAYYYENDSISIINNIDYKTFTVLSPEYAKDRNMVYFKYNIVNGADAESFIVPHRLNRSVGQDKDHRYVNGMVDDK